MSAIPRIVLDTSTLVSAALKVGSVPHQTLLKALGSCQLCASTETLAELEEVLERLKFDRYVSLESRRTFVGLIRRNVHLFTVDRGLLAVKPLCRDTKDQPFLALAMAAEADALVSGDEDLLVLHPWNGIPILTPSEFLERGF
ncbi:MAG: putative toxin-antitoxin system toxin component, PIN family [Terracidiphilus sp.]|jgi:putative PIN family toxin of toxin-antitoxin system